MERRENQSNFNNLFSTVVTNNSVIQGKHDLYLIDATAAALTITLPNAVAFKNLAVYIKKIDSSGNAVTIATSNSQTIDGQSTQSLASQYSTIALVSDGKNWQIKTVVASSTFTGGTITGATTINVANANALVVGPNGTTNPTLQVDTSVASEATGIRITGAAVAAGVTIATISSGTNEAMTITPKGTGALTLGNGSNTQVNFGSNGSFVSAGGAISTNTTIAARANAAVVAGGQIVMGWTTTASFGIFVGSGAPTVSGAQGSLYIRSDGSSTSTRLYVNNSAGSGTTWTPVTTAA